MPHKEPEAGTRYYEWNGVPCRVHSGESGDVTADMFYAEFGHVPIDPKLIEGGTFVISRDRYDEFVEIEKSWFDKGVFLTELPGEIGGCYIWRGRPMVTYSDNGVSKAAVFVGPDRFYPEDIWYGEWADLAGGPYPAPTSEWTYEDMVEQEKWNYSHAKANATRSQSDLKSHGDEG
jgi:hypothetical protein